MKYYTGVSQDCIIVFFYAIYVNFCQVLFSQGIAATSLGVVKTAIQHLL